MIRDLTGKTMSKSLGNSPDPVWLIDGANQETVKDFSSQNPSYKGGVPAYGADAIRLTMVYLTPLGGDIHFDQSDPETAIYYYDKAISIKFDDPELWIKKGDLHRSRKSYQQASNAYQKAINANPEYVKAWVRNGAVMLLMQDESTALEYLNTALALEPDNADVAHQRGLIFYSLEKHEDALDDFDKAFSVEPSNPMHLYYRALMLEILDRPDEAKRTWVVAHSLFEQAGDVTKAAECNTMIKRIV